MFERDQTAEFEYLLAEKLGRTVAELRAGISQQEFLEWGVYHARIAQRKELENAKLKG